MAVQEVVLNTKPAQPVPYNEAAVLKVLNESYLIADTKEDGVQLNLVVRNDLGSAVVDFLSRAGKRLPALQDAYRVGLKSELVFSKLLADDRCIYPDGFMVQAEIVTPGQPAEVTAGSLRRVANRLDLSTIEIHVFGVVPLDVVESGEDHDVTHGVMKYHVEAITALLQLHVPQIKWSAVETIDVFTREELQRVYEIRRANGKEGLVLKDPNAIWKRGKKVGQWKMKPEEAIDGKVVGLVWGTPGLGNEGKVIGFEVELEDGHVVNACGLTDEQKVAFTEAVTGERIGDQFFPFTCPINVFEGWAVEVGYMERFRDGSLRHPSFNRWRGISDPLTKE